MTSHSIELRIRPFLPEDREAWEPLWQGYLTFYKSTLPSEVTQATWQRLLDPDEPMHGLAAIVDGGIVGIVHFLYHRSTWSTGDYCYLQDLFTSGKARNRGVGRALIEAVYGRAEADGASRVYWLTHDTNTSAQALYDKIAARSGFIQYRHLLTGIASRSAGRSGSTVFGLFSLRGLSSLDCRVAFFDGKNRIGFSPRCPRRAL